MVFLTEIGTDIKEKVLSTRKQCSTYYLLNPSNKTFVNPPTNDDKIVAIISNLSTSKSKVFFPFSHLHKPLKVLHSQKSTILQMIQASHNQTYCLKYYQKSIRAY